MKESEGDGKGESHFHVDVDVDVECMYELRQSPLCPPQTYDLHSNDTIKFLVFYSTALRLPVPSNCALKS